MLEFTLKYGWHGLIGAAVVASICIRLFVATTSAADIDYRTKAGGEGAGFWRCWWIRFRGFGSKDQHLNEYWTTFLLGVIECTVFPILIVSGKYEFVGGWLVLKTVAQWKRWSSDRTLYNRFLIASAFVIIVSYWFAVSLFVHAGIAESAGGAS